MTRGGYHPTPLAGLGLTTDEYARWYRHIRPRRRRLDALDLPRGPMPEGSMETPEDLPTGGMVLDALARSIGTDRRRRVVWAARNLRDAGRELGLSRERCRQIERSIVWRAFFALPERARHPGAWDAMLLHRGASVP